MNSPFSWVKFCIERRGENRSWSMLGLKGLKTKKGNQFKGNLFPLWKFSNKQTISVLSYEAVSKQHSYFFIAECRASALGMEDGRIKKGQISASAYVVGNEPWQGRLNNKGLSWRANHDRIYFNHLWFQVDFTAEVVLFTHLATQGNSELVCYVKFYSLAFKPQVFHPWLDYTVGGESKVCNILRRLYSVY